MRAYYDALYSTSSRTYLYYFGGSYSSTRRFNCHGYAWNMVEGGPVRWIGLDPYNTDEHIYWEDGSYIEVCNEMYPGKVRWASGDHSAITTTTPGRWISKWNEYPLVEHNWNDTPYGTSNLKYYVSTSISGSTSLLCSGTRTFSVANISGATYTWSVNGSVLSIVSGQGTHQVTVQRNGSNSGQGWIEVAITAPCATGSATSKREHFHVGLATLGGLDWTYNFPPGRTTLYIDPILDATAYQWYVDGVLKGTTTFNIFSINNTELPCDVPIVFGVRAVTPCGVSAETYEWAEIPCFLMAFTVYPNPADETLTVAMGSEAERSGVPDKAALPVFKAILLDGRGRQLRQSESKEGKVEFDTRQLPEGTYFLHIHHNGEVEKRQVVIRH